MPISPISFPILDFDHVMPGFKAAQDSLNLRSTALQNALMGQQVRNQPDNLQAQLENLKARTGLVQQQSKFLPLGEAIKAQQVGQVGGRFGSAYQLARAVMAMPQAARAQWMVQNQGQWNDVLNTLGNKSLQQQTSMPQQITQGLMTKLFPEQTQQQKSQQATQQPQDMSAQLQQLQQPGATQVSAVGRQQQLPLSEEQMQKVQTAMQQMKDSPAPFVTTPKNIQGLKSTNKMIANSKTAGSAVYNRAQYAAQMEDWLQKNQPKYSKMINNALQYAGAVGQGKKAEDAYLNKNPDALSDYNAFKNSFTTFVSNNIKLMDKMGATDQQKIELQGMMHDAFSALKSNPKLAKMQLNKIFDMIHEQAKSVMSIGQPVFPGELEKQKGLQEWRSDYLDYAPPSKKQKSAVNTAAMPRTSAATANNDPWGIR